MSTSLKPRGEPLRLTQALFAFLLLPLLNIQKTTPPLRSSLFSSCNLFSAPGVRRLCRKLEPLLTLYKSSQRNAPYLLLEPLTLISTPDTLKTSSASLSAPPLTIIHKKWRTHLMAVS